ncbi:MAG: Bifunctional uridylyltransferase/uridylyl-removing enzyme [Candidatus Methanoperedenaceae archaeon GB37]|nr:Bifunctional uridylyltransferase/uridylyl-removing enzyme [Candidatus Methanoperedenaceae archaeon GB37]CAD7779878.1 MAG: Bifunctional uridylyltransferase/uridylyl-removing enzyme [Candidatus Methanoperedenaceae archaeon GB37]
MIDLVKEREELIKKHLAGASGIEIVNGYTQVVDKFIKEQWERLIPKTVVDEVAIIAIGGYGRKEMSFYSDAGFTYLACRKAIGYSERCDCAFCSILVGQ